MAKYGRLQFPDVPGSERVLTPEFAELLTALLDEFTFRIEEARAARLTAQKLAAEELVLPRHPAVSSINTEPWEVPPVPAELRLPGIEISGPAHVTSMFINALNPMPDGTRAEGDLDDDEDAAGHSLAATVQAALNRLAAVDGSLEYEDAARGRHYRLEGGPLPFFMHRERGLHLDEQEVTLDGKAVSATVLGTALTLFWAGRAQAERGQGIYSYLPKLESASEAAIYRDLYAAIQSRVPELKDATIRGVVLVESLPAVMEMEEILHALGPYAAGLNAARWDLKASIIEFVMADPNSVWPDRFGVDIKTTPFMANIFRRLVAICLKHNAVPIGGMATALPHRDEAVNAAAAEAIRADKEWEAQQGFLRGWVAHIYHMATAAAPFKELRGSGWEPSPEMADPSNFPVVVERPDGPITVEGTRRNARMLLEYLEGWMGGRGAKGIDSLAGRPGLHGALMEDLATARISTGQIAQRLLHGARDEATGEVHDEALVKRLLREEADDIVRRMRDEYDASDPAVAAQLDAAEARYEQAYKISMRWIKNYTEINFRSLGTYTRSQLAEIAAAPGAM